MAKSLSDKPPRLQRFFLCVVQLTFTLQYVPGKEPLIADTLSQVRAPCRDTTAREPKNVSIHDTTFLLGLVSSTMRKKPTAATSEDEDSAPGSRV